MKFSIYLNRRVFVMLTSTLLYALASNWQLPFLNQQKGENDCRNYFMINLHESYAAELGFKHANPGSAVKRTKAGPLCILNFRSSVCTCLFKGNWAMEPGVLHNSALPYLGGGGWAVWSKPTFLPFHHKILLPLYYPFSSSPIDLDKNNNQIKNLKQIFFLFFH